MQLQVLAMLGSLSGIAYPTRVASLISVARLANLDLVRFAALPQGPPTSISTVKGLVSGAGATSSGMQPAFTHRLLHHQRRPLRLARGYRAVHCGHQALFVALEAGCVVRKAAAGRKRLLRSQSAR